MQAPAFHPAFFTLGACGPPPHHVLPSVTTIVKRTEASSVSEARYPSQDWAKKKGKESSRAYRERKRKFFELLKSRTEFLEEEVESLKRKKKLLETQYFRLKNGYPPEEEEPKAPEPVKPPVVTVKKIVKPAPPEPANDIAVKRLVGQMLWKNIGLFIRHLFGENSIETQTVAMVLVLAMEKRSRQGVLIADLVLPTLPCTFSLDRVAGTVAAMVCFWNISLTLASLVGILQQGYFFVADQAERERILEASDTPMNYSPRKEISGSQVQTESVCSQQSEKLVFQCKRASPRGMSFVIINEILRQEANAVNKSCNMVVFQELPHGGTLVDLLSAEKITDQTNTVIDLLCKHLQYSSELVHGSANE